MKKTCIDLKNLVVASFFTLSVSAVCYADGIKRPKFVDEVSKDKLEDAGGELNSWLFVFVGVCTAISCVRPVYSFLTGKTEQAWHQVIEVVMAVVCSAFLAGLVFAVAARLNG